jgi:heme/copper-type cytochrome/quinol oxidase subunit 1
LFDALFIHWQMAGLAPSTGWTSYPPLSPSVSPSSTVETFVHDIYYVVSRTAAAGFGGIASRIVIGFTLIFAGTPLGRLLAPSNTEATPK